MNDIKTNLNNKDELKKIINNVNSIIIGTIKVKEYMVTTKDKGLPLLHIDESNNISKNEVLNNIKVFINGKNVDKDKLIIDDYHYIDYKLNNSQESKTLNVCIEISNALMKKIINMSNIFWLTKYISLDLSNFDTSNVTSMSGMFCNCEKLKEIKGINNFNTSNVINMYAMFDYCKSLEFLYDISKWDTSNVENMACMFASCEKLKEINGINNFNTSKVINMESMFQDCKSLEFLSGISKWNISNVNNMNYMFKDCKSLKFLPDISKWDTSNVKNMKDMFSGCNKLRNIPKWYKDR